MTDDSPARATYEATVEEIAAGMAVCGGGRTTCATTGATLREGDTVVARVCRTNVAGDVVWGVHEVYHPAAVNASEGPDDALADVLVRARLAVRSDSATQDAALVLAHPTLVEAVSCVDGVVGDEPADAGGA